MLAVWKKMRDCYDLVYCYPCHSDILDTFYIVVCPLVCCVEAVIVFV